MQQVSINDSLEGPGKKQFWEQHTALHKRSGLTRQEYCQRNNLHYHRFLYWHAKLKSQRTQLIPIALKSSEAHQQALCTIELKSGYRLLIHDHTIVTQLLERLS